MRLTEIIVIIDITFIIIIIIILLFIVIIVIGPMAESFLVMLQIHQRVE